MVRRELNFSTFSGESNCELNLYCYLLIQNNGKANGIISWLGYFKWDSNWSKQQYTRMLFVYINKRRCIPLPIAQWLPNMLFVAVSKLPTVIGWERLYLYIQKNKWKINLKSSQFIQYLVLSLCNRIDSGIQNTEKHCRT